MRKDSIRSIRGDRRFRIAFIILFLIIIAVMIGIFRYFIWPLLFAVVFYIALKPLHDRLRIIVRKNWICTLLIVTAFVGIVIIPFFYLLYALADQTFQFYQILKKNMVAHNVQQFIYSDDHIRAVLKTFDVSKGELLHKIVGILGEASDKFLSKLTGMVGLSMKFLVNFLFMIMILAALFSEGKRLGDFMYRIIPFPREVEQNIYRRLREVIKVLVAGNIVIMILQGVAVASGFLIFDIKIPVLGGFLGALFSLIPVVGTSVVWLPAVIMYALSGKYISAILLGVWCLGWYLFFENFAKPKFFGNRLNFHPLVFFFLLIGSIAAFNLPGIILGPILLTIFFSLWEIYRILYIYPNEEYDTPDRKKKKPAK